MNGDTPGEPDRPADVAGLDAVYQALLDSIHNGVIDLVAATDSHPALGGLRPVLTALRIAGTWPVSTDQPPSEGATEVVLDGDADYGLPGAGPTHTVAVRVELTYSLIGVDRDRFRLRLGITTPDWTFGQTFAELPSSMIADKGQVGLSPSFLVDLRLESPRLTGIAGTRIEPAVTLDGTLPSSPALGPYATFFEPPFDLSGPVTLPLTVADPPDFALSAVSASPPSLGIGPAKLANFGLVLISRTGLDPNVYLTNALSSLEAQAIMAVQGEDYGTASADLLTADVVWVLTLTFDPEATGLDKGLAQIASLFGIGESAFSLPPGLEALAEFYFSELEIAFVPPDAPGGPALSSLAVTLQSKSEWVTPIPKLSISDVGMRWLVSWSGLLPDELSGSFFGSLDVRLKDQDKDKPDFSFDISATFPGFVIRGVLAQGEISISEALKYFFDVTGPEDLQLAVTALEIAGDPLAQTLAASAAIEGQWKPESLADIDLPFTGLSLWVDIAPGSVGGGIEAFFVLPGAAPKEPKGQPDPVIFLSASHAGGGSADGWVFAGGLLPSSQVDLLKLIFVLIGTDAPGWVPSLVIERLNVTFAAGSGRFEFDGAFAARWRPKILGSEVPIAITAQAKLERADKDSALNARLGGTFAVNRIEVGAAVNLLAGQATYELSVDFDGWKISAFTGLRGTGDDQHQVISFQLTGATLGDMVEYLANLAAPTQHVTLESPWDLLNKIELDRFTVTVDPTESAVELVYDAGGTTPAMSVGTIGLRYQPVRGKPSVKLILTGDFLGKSYPADKPLSWDLMGGSPPSVPGQGKQLLDLRYLGVGQRVRFRGALPSTVREAVNKLAAEMAPAKPDTNPVQGQPGLAFAADSQWLIGLDATIAETLDLAIVFNDPLLYGASVGLNGERAGALAGLRFEILYKKITDDIGVYRAELTVPDAFRKIQLGAVSVTLGVIVVEVYTNGGFFVDLGFPHNRDFARSFTVEFLPFIGRGGVYFGVLDSATSSRVPAITNGTFSPVIVAGIGLTVGVGKEVQAGPLSGGAFVEVIGIFEGVFGWFAPASAGTPPAQYFWVQAMVAIHGKVYGSVDFGVIKVSATIEAWAQATVTMQAYRAAIFYLYAWVTVSASAWIIFFEVSFSFSARIELTFTAGSDQPTPWILASGQGGASQQRLRRNVLPPLTSRPDRRRELLAAEHRLARPAEHSGWDPRRRVFPDGPRATDLTLLPVFSVTNVPVDWTGQPPVDGSTDYRVAFCLFAENGERPGRPDGTVRTRTADLSARAAEPADLAVAVIVEALLRWAIAAVTGSAGGDGTSVTSGQLAVLLGQLRSERVAAEVFGAANLSSFFAANLHLRISGDPGETKLRYGGTPVPMPPALLLRSTDATSRDFASYCPVGPLYLSGVAQYAARFSPMPGPAGAVPADDPGSYVSMASQVFGDWCLMVTTTAVQAAADRLARWPATFAGPASLASIAGSFPPADVSYVVRVGDTIDQIAAELGASTGELAFRDPGLGRALADAAPGDELRIKLGPSPESVAADCAGLPLAPVTARLGTIDRQASDADTLDAIAKLFGHSGAIGLFPGDHPPLADDAALLRPGAALTAPEVTLDWDYSRLLAAATFFSRYVPDEVPAEADWYAAAVFELNKEVIHGGAGVVIPRGTPMRVPRALYSTQAQDYRSVRGDTLGRIAAALALAQCYVAGPGGPPGWAAFRDEVSQAPDGRVTIPERRVLVLPGETLTALRRRTIVHGRDLLGLLDWVGGLAILRPLALVPVPDARLEVKEGDTLAKVAARTGLALPDLAIRLGDQPVLAGQGPGGVGPLAVTITGVPLQRIDALVDAVLATDALSNIASQSARQLLSGQRLPAPEPDGDGHLAATGPLRPLYDLTGQMITGPVPDPVRPGETALEVTFTLNPGAAGWISLLASETVGPGVDRAALEARIPDLTSLNPGLAVPGRLREGLVVSTGPVSELVFAYTNAQLAGLYPATALAVRPEAGPAALPTAETLPRRYGLDRRITVQSPVALPVPATGSPQLAGAASAWPLPGALLDAARAGSQTRYDVVLPANAAAGPAPGGGTILGDTTFAAMLTFGLRRLDDRPHVYELAGADTEGRETALRLWRYLSAAGTPPGSLAFLACAPPPDAADPAGLMILTADPKATYLIKTNLSTEQAPPVRAAGRPDGQRWFANLGQLAEFCLLLWEGSVTSGGGYYAGFATTAGDDLPLGVFDSEGTVRITLLVVPGKHQQHAPAGRRLLPADTCVLAAASLDPAAPGLFVEAAHASETITEPALPPGTAGFTVTLPKPRSTPSGPADADDRLRQLFSLVTCEIPAAKGEPFTLPSVGIPAGPLADDGRAIPLWLRECEERWRRTGREGAESPEPAYWRYLQAFPISTFGPASPAPAVPGLPDPAADPYRGIAGTDAPVAGFRLGFADLLGNVTRPGDSGRAEAVVGYTDPLLPVTSWPGAALGYRFTRTGGQVTLTVTVTSEAGATDQGSASLRAQRYAAVCDQLADRRVSAAVLATLHQDGAGNPEPMHADCEPLWRYAAAAYLAANAAAALRPATAAAAPRSPAAVSRAAASGLREAPPGSPGARDPLVVIAADFGVSIEEIAVANLATPVAELFDGIAPTHVIVPAYVTMAAGDTADVIVADARPGWPRPANGGELLALPENAGTLPLVPEVLLATPDLTVPLLDVRPTPALADLAALTGTEPGQFAQDNADAPVLAVGFAFEFGDARYVVDETPFSLRDVQRKFAEAGVHAAVATLAAAVADRPGMFEPTATLTSRHYLAADGDTLSRNGSRSTPGDLARHNGAVPDLFPAGAVIYLGRFDPARVNFRPGESLADFAGRYGCPPGLLLAANADTPVRRSAVVIPGATMLPAGADAPRVPGSLSTEDTLNSVAARFGTTALDLGVANAAMPGTLAPECQIRVLVDGQTASWTTGPGDSFADVYTELAKQVKQVTFADLIGAIAAVPGFLAEGGLLACPPAVLPGRAGELLTPEQAADLYHLSAAALGQANATALNLVAPDVWLTDALGEVTIVTGRNDTLTTLASRFAAAGAAITITEIIAANAAVAFMRPGARLLLPPAPARVQVTMPEPGPLADPVLPLSVTLRLTRPTRLVDPAFRTARGDGPAERADSACPAPAADQGRGDAATLTLAAFAADFTATFPQLRLGTVRGGPGGTTPDVWVVDFRDRLGIADLRVEPGVPMPDGTRAPRFFALRPLSRTPVTRLNVPVQTMRPDGSLTPESPADFQGIDAEIWAQRALADTDLFLSAAYAAGMYADPAHPAARDALRRVLDAKAVLVQAVAAGLAPVLEVTDPGAQAGHGAAVQTLAQALAVSLRGAYDIAAVVQYDTTVDSPWTRGAALPPARVTGTAEPAAPGQRPFTLSSGTTPLDEARSVTSLLLRVPDPGRPGAIEAELRYDLLDLRFGIEPVAGATGYETGRWLAFYPPLAGPARPPAVHTDVGSATVPVPLRVYPAQPVIGGQSASATIARPGWLPETTLWTYALTYVHEHTEQDEVLVTARFNTPASDRAGLGSPAPDDVFTALARYAQVADELWALLARYADAKHVPTAAAARAAAVFADRVAHVADRWAAHWADQAAADPGSDREPGAPLREVTYEFSVRAHYSPDQSGTSLLDTVRLEIPPGGSRAAAQPGHEPRWPLISCRRPDGHLAELRPDEPAGPLRVYRVPAADRIPAGQPHELSFRWPGLPVSEFCNGRVELSVRRNQRLLGPDGPATREDFVFTTPVTQAPDAVVPQLRVPGAMTINDLGSTLEDALVTAFEQLSGSGSLRGTVGINYAYPLTPAPDPADGLVVYVPVSLDPDVALTADGARRIAAEATRWESSSHLEPGPGRMWAFSVAVRSQLDPRAQQPLLLLDQLIYQIGPNDE